MAINIRFDLSGNPEPPTIILATRNGQKLGLLEVEPESIDLSDKFNDASEISFTLNKYVDNRLTNLWDKVVNFKLIYCKEWDMWFEIKVELDEETETVKTVFCKQLGQAELSQIKLYNIEINTEADIERDDYKISILYDENDPEASILNRLLKDKAPHYHIVHVDSTIAKIQRMFSFDDISICDAFQEISEEIGCLFVYHSDTDENGGIRRGISVYDLQQNCNDCGHRGEFNDECPKCGSTNIDNGYGEDTLIFVTADELASDGIQLTTDTDSVKNCFKLEAGDDLMTTTIRNCNSNGTDYIWYISDAVKEDMSEELVNKIKSYDELYNTYQNNYEFSLDKELVEKYNELVEKYSVYNEDLEQIQLSIVGYPNLMNAYYNTIDLAIYLQSALMPSVEMIDTDAKKEAEKLTANNISPVSVNSIKNISVATADNVVLAMAKIIIDSRYRVKVKTSSLEKNELNCIWTGNFTVTNYFDEEDSATSEVISVVVDDNYSAFVQQKIQKALNKEDTEDLSISGLFEKEYDNFVLELKKYSLNCLDSFYKTCQVCIDILIEQGLADKETWSGQEPNLYEDLYLQYLQKMSAIESEMKIRQEEIYLIVGVYDENGDLKTYGVQNCIIDVKTDAQKILNFQDYLGNDLWLEFCTFRREDKYSNDNYISDGLNNAELFKKAQEFIEVANNEIFKSAELQHSISTTLNNLLAIPKFKPLVKSFKTGNWIRVQIDDVIYKLRLLDYDISYGDFNNIPVTFSDVIKIKNGITDVKDILSQASSMATSYDSVKRQSKQGDEAKEEIENWYISGLNSALVNIKNNDNEEITFNNNGILARSYNDILEEYSPEQMRITHNVLALTEDNWETVSLGVGKHDYLYYDSDKLLSEGTGYGVSAKFLSAGYINGSQIIGGEIFSQNYSPTAGTYMNLNDGTFSWAGGKIKYNGSDLILSGVNLAWVDIKDAPSIPSDEYITTITKNTITTDYVNALNITAGSVAAENITGTTIIGKTIIVGGENNGNGSIVVKDEYGASICTIDVNGITLKSQKYLVQNELAIISGRYIYKEYAPYVIQYASGKNSCIGTEDTSTVDGYIGGCGYIDGNDGSWGADTGSISVDDYANLKISTYISRQGADDMPTPYLYLYGDDVLIKSYKDNNLLDLLGMNSFNDNYGTAELDVSLYKTVSVKFIAEDQAWEVYKNGVLANEVTNDGFELSGGYLHLGVGAGNDDSASDEARIRNIDFTDYDKLDITIDYQNYVNYGSSDTAYGIDGCWNIKLPDSNNQRISTTISIDISSYTGMHYIGFGVEAENKSSEPTWHADSNVWIKEIRLYKDYGEEAYMTIGITSLSLS